MASVIDVASAQIERVHNKVEQYIDKSDQLASLIKKAGGDDGIQVSRYLYRVPWKRWRAGVLGKYNNDGGAYPTGNAPTLASFTAGYYNFALAYRLTQEMIDTMATDAQARTNILTDVTSEAIAEMGVQIDIALHTDGTGLLTSTSSAKPAATQLTFAGTTDTIGVDRLRPGTTVDIWDSAGTTIRANGPYLINNVDYGSKVVTFSSSPTGLTSGDQLSFYGMDLTGTPNHPHSFDSGWPGGGLTASSGLTGDSFIHGLPYVNDATDANYYLGKLKSSYAELKPVAVNASSAALVFQHGLLAIDGLVKRRGTDIAPNLVGVFSMAQRAQVFNIGIAVSNWVRGNNDKSLDLMPSNVGYGATFDFCGVKCYLSNRQDKARVDFFIPKNWRRVQTKDIGFVKNEAGGYLHPVYTNPSSTTVSKATAVDILVAAAMDYTCFDPGAGAYIYGIAVDSSYA
jgi:hypothetical protein